MRVIILAGGRGSRLMEETTSVPKPMVTIGGQPIMWHIMQAYAAAKMTDFIIATGYKDSVIREWVTGLAQQSRRLKVDLSQGSISESPGVGDLDWRITVFNTGVDTQTSGRLMRIMRAFPGEDFALTYGDGLANVDLSNLLEFHRSHDLQATVTAVRPPARFGKLELAGDAVTSFDEKAHGSEGWINGGFFFLRSAVLGVLEEFDSDRVPLERGPMARLASAGQLMAYKHEGFWQPMDTMRDRLLLEDMWASGQPPWKTW